MGKPLTIDEIRRIGQRIDESTTLTVYAKAQLRSLIGEIVRLRQGLWDVAGISGADLDGDATPDAMTYPDIVDYAKREVQQLRDDYDEALAEVA